MGMAQLVVAAVVVEGRSKSEVARQYGVGRGNRDPSCCDGVILVDEAAEHVAAPDISEPNRHRAPAVLVAHVGNGQCQAAVGPLAVV